MNLNQYEGGFPSILYKSVMSYNYYYYIISPVDIFITAVQIGVHTPVTRYGRLFSNKIMDEISNYLHMQILFVNVMVPKQYNGALYQFIHVQLPVMSCKYSQGDFHLRTIWYVYIVYTQLYTIYVFVCSHRCAM